MRKSAFIFVLVVVITTIAGAQRVPDALQKLLNAEYAISNFYVDSVDENKLVEDAIVGMLEKLDPHSSYTDAKETKEFEEPLQGEFSGIGIQFNMKQDTLYVIQTIAGGPSEKVGIIPGDRIVTVNDSNIAGVKMKNTDIMKRLRGKKGTNVTVQVKRRGVNELITFRIKRDDIPLHSVDAKYMLDERTGFVRITNFGLKTHGEVVDAIEELKRQGMTQVIIDLSDNGGGYLEAAVDICNEFLERDRMIVYTQGNTAPRSEARANGRGRYRDMKMVLIVSQYSASAAEIFSGAMQDWDRAVVVGRRTFAKGLVQRPIRFNDGSMMRLTVARYYTPSGRCIQKPYTAGDKRAYDEDILNRYNAGEYYNVDSVKLNDSLQYRTLVNGRVIYGGGGIMPDVFVGVDTTEYSKYYRNLVAKGIINQYCIDYVDRHRKQIEEKYKTVAQFDRDFAITDADMSELIAMGERDSVSLDSAQYETSKMLLARIMKGIIARDVFSDTSAYTIVVNHFNPDVKTALDVINDDERYNRLLKESNEQYARIAASHRK